MESEDAIVVTYDTASDQDLLWGFGIGYNYFDDLEALKLLLPSSARYIGLLGARSRSQQLVQDGLIEGAITSTQLSRLYAPVGLDIGATTPVEIALAIITEIQMVLTGRSGRSLKDREAPIISPLNLCVNGVTINE